jgi:hypothetical protein
MSTIFIPFLLLSQDNRKIQNHCTQPVEEIIPLSVPNAFDGCCNHEHQHYPGKNHLDPAWCDADFDMPPT